MTRELAQNILTEHIRLMSDIPLLKEDIKAFQMAISALEQKPCEDAVSREKVKKWICKTCPDDAECQKDCDVIKGIDALPSVTPRINTEKLKAINKYCYDYGRQDGRNENRRKGQKFAEWVADEIFDEEWENNKDSFAEIACRKLEKLGLVRQEDNEWIKESSDADSN
jgi:hypothetical protein